MVWHLVVVVVAIVNNVPVVNMSPYSVFPHYKATAPHDNMQMVR